MDMANAMSVVALIGLIFVAAFYRLKSLYWTILIFASLLVFTLFNTLSVWFLLFSWLFFLPIALFANLHRLRQKYVIKPLLDELKKKMPTISTTEREALEAGNTWWEKELFCGRPNWQSFFNISRPQLSETEEAFLNQKVETLCKMIDDWQVNQDHDLSPSVWEYLKKERFFGLVIPKEYGGLAFSALAHSTIVAKIASRSVSAAVNTMVPNSLGPAELLLHYGTAEQKKYYLPRLAQGEEIPCFALTAPEAGSDAGAMPDTGIVCYGDYQNQRCLGIRLNWDKRYITLAPVATVLGLAFRLFDPDHLLGAVEDIGITLCLIPAQHEGVEIGNRHFPLQLAFMNGPVRGKNVFIPLDWIIGGQEMAGQGWRMLMECLSIGRSISLPALSTACGKVAYRFTGAYAKIRKQFNTSLAHFEGITESLGYIAGYTYTLEACRLMTAYAVDLNIKPSIASAIAKYHMTEMSRKIVAYAMDIHAGQAIQVGPRNFLANVHFAIPMSITVEGANILTRNLIIFGQGAIRCHPFILNEIQLISDSTPDVKKLDQTLMSHLGYLISNFICAFMYGLTGGYFIKSKIKNKRIKNLHKQITRMSCALSVIADLSLMLLGGQLKRRERISARLGDILSQLYLASSVLKYYEDLGSPQSDIDMVCWSIQYALYKIQESLDELAANFPIKIVGKILHFVIFPFGRAYHIPSDKLHANIVEFMLHDNLLRDRLTQHCFISDKTNDISCRLDTALKQAEKMDIYYKKIHDAVKSHVIKDHPAFSARLKDALALGILSADEAKQLENFEELKNEIIKVNEFSFDLKKIIA